MASPELNQLTVPAEGGFTGQAAAPIRLSPMPSIIRPFNFGVEIFDVLRDGSTLLRRGQQLACSRATTRPATPAR